MTDELIHFDFQVRFRSDGIAEAFRLARSAIGFARRQIHRHYRADPTRLRRRHMHTEYRRRGR